MRFNDRNAQCHLHCAEARNLCDLIVICFGYKFFFSLETSNYFINYSPYYAFFGERNAYFFITIS